MKTQFLTLAGVALAFCCGSALAQTTPTNAPPTITLPAPITVECTNARLAVTATVEDVDGDALTAIWYVNGRPVKTNDLPAVAGGTNSASLSITNRFPLGTNEVKLSVADGVNPAVDAMTQVTVVDTTPPEIRRLVATPRMLWPPNHKMVLVRLTADIRDCSPTRWRITGVRSDEPEDDRGDGKFAPDYVIGRDGKSVYLRAERMGGGDGRIYTVQITATDSSDNSSTARTRVVVPHDMGKGKEKDDDRGHKLFKR